jgi:hypothetical protein
MSKSNTLENGILNLIFRKTAIAGLATAGIVGGGQDEFFVSLHTASPGDTGDQTTNETSYTSYARVAVPRATGGWTQATDGATFPFAIISFPQCTGGTATITHAAIGSATSGAGTLYYWGTVTPNLPISNGVTPRLTTSSTVTED